MIYFKHYIYSYTYLSRLSSSSIALLIEIIQPLVKDLEELEKDFFYKGECVVNKCTYKNIEDSNMDIFLLY